jgi:exosortase K
MFIDSTNIQRAAGVTWTRAVQLLVVLLGALTLKLYYSIASPDELRWILAPTTVLVELVSGRSFEFESHAGYLSDDRSFLIAGSCAGVNFLITAFLMLALRKLWKQRSQRLPWQFIPTAAVFAYLATLIANTVRISTALHLQRTRLEIGDLSGNQLHRFEGIIVYFGFLLLLFVVSERLSGRTESDSSFDNSSHREQSAQNRFVLLRQSLFPLVIYYGTALGIPFANAILRQGITATDFWQHSFFVLLTPWLFLLPLAIFNTIRFPRLWDRASLGSRASRPQ